jgi:hypothetical protein
LNQKIVVFAIASLFFGLLGNASAHKSEVVGNYEIEVGWENEPPIAGKENAITIMITPVPTDDAIEDDRVHEEIHDNTNQTITETEHEHGENSISGLASILDVSITLDDEKTDLVLVEDGKTPGLYIGAYTPSKVGHPLVHVFGTINEESVEVTFHPEAIENAHMNPIQQQNDGVEPRNVVCPEDLVLLGKKTTSDAICVTQKTADLLVARDWAFYFE